MQLAEPSFASLVEVDHILGVYFRMLFENAIEERGRPAQAGGRLILFLRMGDAVPEAVDDVGARDAGETLLMPAGREGVDELQRIVDAKLFGGHGDLPGSSVSLFDLGATIILWAAFAAQSLDAP